MPTYDYQCRSCGNRFDEWQPISAEALVTCPSCGNDTLARVIGGGAGLIFRGSGFYLTDYKKGNNSNVTKKDPAPAAEQETDTSTKVPSDQETKPTASTP